MHRTADEGSPAVKSSHRYQSIGFDKESLQLLKESFEQPKAAIYYQTDPSLTPGRPSSPLAMRTSNDYEYVKNVDHSHVLHTDTTPTAPSSAVTSTPNNPTTATLRSSYASNSTLGTRSSTTYIDELRATQYEGEKRELGTLNHRFGNYLDRIKNLASANADLRRQVDQTYRQYIGHTEEKSPGIEKRPARRYQHPCEAQLNTLRKQINEEVRAQTLLYIRVQRADFDIQFYQNNIKSLTTHDQKQSEQLRTMQQQLAANVQELDLLQRQYERQAQDLNTYKSQYDEYMNKLTQFSNEYDVIAYERLDSESTLCTLREHVAFEHEFYQRRKEEFDYLEKLQRDLNKQFSHTEFHQIVERIRQDYREFNTIRLSELETLYQTKLDAVRKEFLKRQEQQAVTKPHELHSIVASTKTQHQALIEENQLLQNKLERLQHDLHDVIEQNRQRYELSEREYKQLQAELPERDMLLVHLRESAVNLGSEINTYKYLLLNLLSPTKDKSPQSTPKLPPLAILNSKPVAGEKQTTTSTTTEKIPMPKPKPVVRKVTSTTTVGTKARSSPQQYRDDTTGFIVHIEDGIIWVRI